MKAVVSPEADRELTEGAIYYAREGGAELGLAFIAEFERTLALLCSHPEMGVEGRNSRRRFPLRRFPLSMQTSFTEHEVSRKLNKEIFMKVSLIDRQPATVAYLRHLGPFGEPIARFWQETYVPWAVMNNLGPDHARYGISHDDPSITAPGQCRYDACAEVSPDFMATGSALKMTIPGGKYAVLNFRGTVEQVGEAWAALLRDWLPSSGLQLDGRPCFEYYPKGESYDCETGEFECEICIPVVPL